MQTKLLCLEVLTVPESNAPDAEDYFRARFKRVACPKKGATDEQKAIASECVEARLDYGTYNVDDFKVGRVYRLTLELESGIQESLAERIDAAAAVDELKKLEVELNQAELTREQRAELVTQLSNARKRLAAK